MQIVGMLFVDVRQFIAATVMSTRDQYRHIVEVLSKNNNCKIINSYPAVISPEQHVQFAT